MAAIFAGCQYILKDFSLFDQNIISLKLTVLSINEKKNVLLFHSQIFFHIISKKKILARDFMFYSARFIVHLFTLDYIDKTFK